MGVSVRGHSDPHLHSPCPRCGYATRYKQWSTGCACPAAKRQTTRAALGPHIAEVEAEQFQKNAELPDLTGLPTLQVAERYAAGRKTTASRT